MKVENTNWAWFSKEEDIKHATRNLENIKMSVTEKFGKYRLNIGHSFKMTGNTYYDLKSKDIESACNEADDIAREEFTRMADWNTRLVIELGETMKFYEFKEFGYYALIGAKTEEEAIEYYNETVSEIEEEDGTPSQINKDEAKIKLFNSTDNEEERMKFIKEFDLCTSTVEPYLILIDGSLI